MIHYINVIMYVLYDHRIALLFFIAIVFYVADLLCSFFLSSQEPVFLWCAIMNLYLYKKKKKRNKSSNLYIHFMSMWTVR